MPTFAPTLPGFTPSDWTAAYGGRPIVPSPGASAGAAIGTNLANLSELYDIGANLNQFQAAQAAGQYAANLPNYSSMLAQSSRNIGSQLRGEVPADVVSQIMQGAAERGIATGQRGPSPNTNAALLRALGLTSLGLQQQGEQNLTGAIGRTPTAPLFQPTSMFVTPQAWQEAQTGANIYTAAPSPAAAARAAENALNRGIGAGAGAIPSYPRMSMPSYGGGYSLSSPSEPGTIVATSLGTGYNYPAGTVTPGALENWQDWASSLSGSRTGLGTGSFYAGPNLTEDQMLEEMGVDVYGPEAGSGWSGGFEDWGSLSDWSNLYGIGDESGYGMLGGDLGFDDLFFGE